MTGSSPRELRNLANLKFLRLGVSPVEGRLPAWLGGLSSLEVLDIAHGSVTERLVLLHRLDQELMPEPRVFAGLNAGAGLPRIAYEGVRDALDASGYLLHEPDGIGERWRERRALILNAWEACRFDPEEAPIVKRYSEMYRQCADAP